jgi:hypothetical protein
LVVELMDGTVIEKEVESSASFCRFLASSRAEGEFTFPAERS